MKIDRLIAIIMILLNCEKISAAQLAQRFEVTPRTIYRDMEVIGQAGIPVFAVAGAEGGFGILPEYKMDKRLFTAADIQTLLMGLDSVSTAIPTKELAGTLEKVKGLMPRQQMVRANQLKVDLTPWMGNRTLLLSLERIREALAGDRLLQFHYRDRTGAEGIRRVEPYQLLLKEARWYLHAYCLGRQDYRLFKVVRMSELSVECSTFIPREFPAGSLDSGSWMKGKLVPVQLVVDVSLYERMVELCGEEHVFPDGEGGDTYRAELLFAPDDDGYRLLLGLGENCECLSPPEVRQELTRRLEKLASRYRLPPDRT